MPSDPNSEQSDTHTSPKLKTESSFCSTTPPPVPAEAILVTLQNDRQFIESFREDLVNELSQAGYNEASCFAIRLAFEETITNAFKHGCCSRQMAAISIDYRITPEEVFLRVTDSGAGFDVKSVPDPTLESNLGNPAGRGLLLIKAYMSGVYFNNQGNSITLIYKCPASCG